MTNVVSDFQNVYYDSLVWTNTYWLGHHIYKCPMDLILYQEILFEIKPDIIIETGTNRGGSALFLASMCDIMNKGKIVTIDIATYGENPAHPRITYLLGDSASPEMLFQVTSYISPGDTVLVILDSDHSKNHVLNEMNAYHLLVSPGSYMIVEDSIVGGNPVLPAFGPGPMDAIYEFISQNDQFMIDVSKHKFHMTWNPNGYLRKIR